MTSIDRRCGFYGGHYNEDGELRVRLCGTSVGHAGGHRFESFESGSAEYETWYNSRDGKLTRYEMSHDIILGDYSEGSEGETVLGRGHTWMRLAPYDAWCPAEWRISRTGDGAFFAMRSEGFSNLNLFEDGAAARRYLAERSDGHDRFVENVAEHGEGYWRDLAVRLVETHRCRHDRSEAASDDPDDWVWSKDYTAVMMEIEGGGAERISQVLLCVAELAAGRAEEVGRPDGDPKSGTSAT
jgi:hypothetical protein